MIRVLSRALILVFACTFAFCMGDEGENAGKPDVAKLTDAEILSIRTDFTSMLELEKFYDAEFKILQNHSDARIIKILEEIEKNNPAPIVRARATKVLKIIQETIEATRIKITEEEVLLLYPKIKEFIQMYKKKPNLNSNNPLEKRMAEAIIYINDLKRKKNAES